MFKKIIPLLNCVLKSPLNISSIRSCTYITTQRINPLSLSDKRISYTQIRTLAKGKDKRKEKGKNKKVVINENEIAEVLDVVKLKEEMSVALDNLRHDLVHKLSLRSTTGGIDTLRFSYKGEKMDLLEVAKINRSNPEMVIVDMSSSSHLLPTVLKAISSSGMNVNAQQDGTSIVIPIPKVTQQFKEGLAKNAKAMFVKCKDSIKDCQNKHLKIVKSKGKGSGVSEDLLHRISEQVSFMADTYISDAEKLLEKKQSELTS